MNTFAPRPEGDGFWGSVDWVPDEKRFHWTEPVEDSDNFENHYGGVGVFKAIFDPENWRRAWIGYVAPIGTGEDKKSGGIVLRGVCRVNEKLCRKPNEAGLVLMNDGWSSGILMRMMLDASLGGGRKELSKATQAVMWAAAGKFYKLWSAQKNAHPGLLPVVVLTGWVKYPTKNGFVAEPVFEIVGWVARPDILPDEPAGQRDDPPAATKRNGSCGSS